MFSWYLGFKGGWGGGEFVQGWMGWVLGCVWFIVWGGLFGGLDYIGFFDVVFVRLCNII